MLGSLVLKSMIYLSTWLNLTQTRRKRNGDVQLLKGPLLSKKRLTIIGQLHIIDFEIPISLD